ncbi:MAG TPA: alpha/beta fold hydrolase [Planctomycetota bacterium]|nr:alpha/beta fold hydrolase [Planctomycetota bacterium]
MSAPEILRDGPAGAAVTIVLAHGAGAGMEHPFLAAVAAGLGAAGFAVLRFEFPHQHEARHGMRRGPDRLPVLQDCFRDVVREHARPPFVLAGKSMGGRVATTIADGLGAAGVIVFGYPFHPPRRPTQLRTAHLAELATPTLILQGERDPFGTRAEVAGYVLSPKIEVFWLADGDHSLVPRKRSGHTEHGHLQAAIERAAGFAAAVTR